MHEPLAKFDQWFTEAKACAAISEPTAMTLATATPDGAPSARIVLLKEVNNAGFTFYTNHTSRKSMELIANPRAALVFYWMPLDKQVRVEGTITRVDDAVADSYFASRGREKQIGAWASLQSQPLDSRATLDDRVTDLTREYEGKPVPRPPHWSGWLLTPHSIEFWEQSLIRLHEREIYTRDASGVWQHTLLYP